MALPPDHTLRFVVRFVVPWLAGMAASGVAYGPSADAGLGPLGVAGMQVAAGFLTSFVLCLAGHRLTRGWGDD